MPSSYTPSLRLTLPVSGELTGTWGDTVNTGITSLVDSSIAGTAAVTMTDANYTLTQADGVTDESRRMFVTLTGTLTAGRNVICPTVSKLYVVKNSTTGGFAITFKTTAGTGIAIPSGATSTLLYCDGTNVVDAVNYLSSLALGTPLPATSGGTGAASLAGASIPTFSSTDTLTNKRITPRVLASTANSATPTLNTDSYDMMVITGQSVAITSFTTNLTGTPTNGQKLWISITGTTAIAITWGASFESSTSILPTTTVTTARLDVGFVWNVATSKWRCVATA